MRNLRTTRDFYFTPQYELVETPKDLNLEIRRNPDTQVAIFFGGKRTKPDCHYKYKTIERMDEAIATYINDRREVLTYKEEQKRLRKIQQEELAGKIEVGDVFCYSWGYEQTNVNFYQVTEKKTAKTMKVREISYNSVEECSWGSDYVVPVKDSFINEKEDTVRVNTYGGFKRSCGSASKTNFNDKHYRSWYA